MARLTDTPIDVYGATLTRRRFVKAGGALIVGFSVVGPDIWSNTAKAAPPVNTLDPSLPTSWIEIHADNTVLIRTGNSDFGQSTTTTAYKQIVAEELRIPFEAVTQVVQGDTDRTPDGGGSNDFLGSYRGRTGPNLRKVAAYTYQALLDLAAIRLGIPKNQLSVKDGVVSGGGQSLTYGQLLEGQQLKLTIPVSGALTSNGRITVLGDPPMKPVSEYTIVGKPYANYVTEAKVAAKLSWATDVRLPGMLHARVVHPKTLGSTLISAGTVDRKRFPTAQVVVHGNLVGVVAANEWEAIRAARQVAAETKWTDWAALPGSGNLFKWLHEEADWKTVPITTGTKNRGAVEQPLTNAARKVSATYELPFIKHAPIGPTMALADVRPDGTVYIYTSNQNPQALRGQIALMLGTSVDNIVVRVSPGSGHYGRSNGGNAGGEDAAVIFSKALGKPVRVQWMRDDDLAWSTQSPAGFSTVEVAVDSTGKIAAYQADHYMLAFQDDRLVGAVLAGLPTMPPPSPELKPAAGRSAVNTISDPWVYDGVENLMERGHGTPQLGESASALRIGLRDHSFRTPGQYQQNFPRELAINEAAALADIDPIELRINNTRDKRVIGVLEAVRKASGWESRPSPRRNPVSSGSAPVRGQGVSVLFRSESYWACVCQVSVTPATGKIIVEKYTIAVDPGIIINPRQLKRQIEGGAIMGISMALVEESTFDRSGVTSRDWRTYPILTMADVPEIEVVLINNPEVGMYGGGSEAANALAAPAIASAVFDATGKVLRRLPLRPAYVRESLAT